MEFFFMSDDTALQLLAAGDVDGAMNQISRQGGTPWACGCVRAAAGKFVEAALSFFEGNHTLEGIATALLEPWQFFPRFKSTRGLPSDLEAAVQAVLNEQLLNGAHAQVIASHLPRDIRELVKVPQRAAEFNIILISRVAESVSLSTLQQYIDGVQAGLSAEALVCDMIERGASCRIDQVDGLVRFSNSTQAARQSAHLLELFNKVEQLSA